MGNAHGFYLDRGGVTCAIAILRRETEKIKKICRLFVIGLFLLPGVNHYHQQGHRAMTLSHAALQRNMLQLLTAEC